MKTGAFAIAAVLVVAVGGPAGAIEVTGSSATISFEQDGANVDVTVRGTIDLSGLSMVGGAFSGPAFLFADEGQIRVGSGTAFAIYSGVHGSGSFHGAGAFSPGGSTTASFAGGDNVGIYGALGELAVPLGYSSGESLFGFAVFDNATLNSLGLTPGNYIYTWGDPNTLTVTVGNGVPEPGTWVMMLTGFAGLGFAGCRASRGSSRQALNSEGIPTA